MLLLMTMPIDDNAGEDAREYLRLRRAEELKKLRKRLSEEDSRQHAHEAREFSVPHEDCPLDQRGRVSRGGLSSGSRSPLLCSGQTSPTPAAAAATGWTRCGREAFGGGRGLARGERRREGGSREKERDGRKRRREESSRERGGDGREWREGRQTRRTIKRDGEWRKSCCGERSAANATTEGEGSMFWSG